MKHRNQLACGLAVALLAGTIPLGAQSTELLELETIVASPDSSTQFIFSDHGTGASDYSVRSAATLGNPVSWEPEPGAIVTPLGNGRYQVTVAGGSPDRFYSVSGADGNGDPIEIHFPSTSLELSEGADGSLTVNFSRAYYGTIQYSVDGSADPADQQGLSGEVVVNGETSVVIPISLSDNDSLGELKQLILTLQSGSGAEASGDTQSVITIIDNDADWTGTITDEPSSVGVTLRIRDLSGALSATLVSDGSGLIPAGEYASSLSLDEDTFNSVSSSIPLDQAETLQGLPANMIISFTADDAVEGQSVEDTEMFGAATLATSYPGNSHLDTSSSGAFALFRIPMAPSTKEATLVTAP